MGGWSDKLRGKAFRIFSARASSSSTWERVGPRALKADEVAEHAGNGVGCRVEGGGWRVAGGGWRVLGEGSRV